VYRGLGESMKSLKTQTLKIAEAHEEAAKNFSMLEQEMTKYIDDQKKKVAQVSLVRCFR